MKVFNICLRIATILKTLSFLFMKYFKYHLVFLNAKTLSSFVWVKNYFSLLIIFMMKLRYNSSFVLVLTKLWNQTYDFIKKSIFWQYEFIYNELQTLSIHITNIWIMYLYKTGYRNFELSIKSFSITWIE